jgi:methionyl-tRNA formyltransferase
MVAGGAKAGRWCLAGILTNPDKPKGRGSKTVPTDVGSYASLLAEEFAALGLPAPAVLKPETLKTEAREAVSALQPDLLVCFAYGRIFGPRFLALFPLGGINVHPSLLPKYRGASPIQEAILRREARTGISIQRLAAEMDTGNILAQETIPLIGTETAASLSETAAERGAEVLQSVLERLLKAAGTAAPPASGPADKLAALLKVLEGTPQQGEPSYCTVIEKSSGVIDWNRSAPEIDTQIRAYNPWPLARTGHNGQILNILKAAPYSAGVSGPPSAGGPGSNSPGQVLGIDKKSGILIQTGNGILAVSMLQYQTKKALHWQAFINGARDFTGSRLSGGF